MKNFPGLDGKGHTLRGHLILSWIVRRLFLGLQVLGMQSRNSWIFSDPETAKESEKILRDYLNEPRNEKDRDISQV